MHTCRLINAEGKSTFVKFHWKPKHGLQSVVWNEALKINGADPDFHRRDMWDAIQTGDYPEWELGMQLFDEEFAEKFDFDVLDATKIIPEEEVPVRIVGRMVLDRVVDNFFAETEQVAFCTNNVVPGIGFTNDPLLQGRNFSYLDTQTKRLGGPNFTHIPINAPKCPMRNFQQDGHMAMRNPTGRANYEPNSWGTEDGGPREDPVNGYRHYPEEVSGQKVATRSETFADHYSQARQFYMSQTETEQTHIANALTFELSKCQEMRVRKRMLSHLRNIDEDLASGVADGLGLELPEPAKAAREPITDLKVSDALSIIKNGPKDFKGRKLGILVGDGSDADLLKSLQEAMTEAGALTVLVAPKVGGVTLSDGSHVAAGEKVDGGPSVLYDAVALVLSEEGAKTLADMPPARDFVTDALAHGKFIGLTGGADPLLKQAGVTDKVDDGCFRLDDGGLDDFLNALPGLRKWDRDA